MLQIVTNEAIA